LVTTRSVGHGHGSLLIIVTKKADPGAAALTSDMCVISCYGRRQSKQHKYDVFSVAFIFSAVLLGSVLSQKQYSD
jgi:hypothetical protein